MSLVCWRSTATRVVSMIFVVFAVLGLAACGSGGDLGPDPGVAPQITTQPASVTADDGTTATFNVVATGGASYQWQRDGANIVGATLATYTTPTLGLADNGAVYTVLVANTAGSTTSNPATLTVVQSAARITAQPADTSVLDGEAATFSVATVGGTPPITYQWFRNGTPIAGATSASYTTPANAMGDSGTTYRVIVTAAGGTATSRDAVLTVTARPPTIAAQPSDAVVTFQGQATFTTQATGTGPITYQWYRNGVRLSGETSSTLTLGSVNYGDDGARYTAVASNPGGDIESAAATLSVAPPTGTQQSLSSCLTITAPGAYRLSADIPTITVAGASCITISASNVQLDCAGRSLGATGTNSRAIALGAVQNVSIKGCTILTPGMTFQGVSNVSVHHNIFTALAGTALTAIEANHATLLAFDNNRVDRGHFAQTYGTAVTVSNNSFTSIAEEAALPALISSSFGTGTRVLGNTLDGRWSAARRGSLVPFGANSGIYVQDESDTRLEGNAISYVFTCGVELIGRITALVARHNNILEAPQCGFAGSRWFSMSSSRFADNVVDRSAIAFLVSRVNGLRAAGFDQPDGVMPADTTVDFRDVTFERNTLRNVIAANGGNVQQSVVVLPITARMGYEGPAGAGETEPGAGQFQLGNVRFVGNNFDRSAAAIEFGPGPFTAGLIVDGGGNVCPPSSVTGFPLACN
jgi:hypothetical protein